jgi:hypothetical protein
VPLKNLLVFSFKVPFWMPWGRKVPAFFIFTGGAESETAFPEFANSICQIEAVPRKTFGPKE